MADLDFRGYTDEPTTSLSIPELLEEALQSAYDSGYYSDKPEYTDLHQTAVNRRRECFAEIENRLKGRKP